MLPGFVVPLFLKSNQDNRLYVQEIDRDYRINAFQHIDVGEALVTPHDSKVILGRGDPALWAFQMEDGSCTIGERETLRTYLAPIERQFSPLVRVQISTLFGTLDVATHIKSANDTIERWGIRSANLWRDLIVLLPRVRQTAHENLQRAHAGLRLDIEAIDLVTRDRTLQIGVPGALIDVAGGEQEFAAWLSPLKPIFSALGVPDLVIQRRSAVSPAAGGPTVQPRGLTIIHCMRDVEHSPARKLHHARHLFHSDLVAAGSVLSSANVVNPHEIALLLIEDDPEFVSAAAAIAEASASLSSMTGALIVPRSGTAESRGFRDSILGSQRLAELARHCHWVAIAGAISSSEEEEFEPVGSNPHFDRQTVEVCRWTPHALRACLNGGQAGLEALRALRTATSIVRRASITTMASPGESAATVAARDALNASRRAKHPATRAQLIVLVAFHNRSLGGETRNEIEHNAMLCNPQARIIVVEEFREDMKKRVRVVAFTTGSQRIAHEAYNVPAQFMPLVRAGWRVGPPYIRSPAHTVFCGGHFYALRFEPELVVRLDDVDDIVASTQMHDGEVALLVRAIEDDKVIERLLSAGIFCARVGSPPSFDRFGSAPGAAMRSAHAGLTRPQICERVGQLARHYALAALWQLTNEWEHVGQSIHAQWAAGLYRREADLERLELHRVTRQGVSFFKGIIRLDPTTHTVPRLRYAFGLALDHKGVRLTKMTPIDGEYDVRAENRRRLRERRAARGE